MNSYFLGADVSKGYCDFVILDSHHNTIEKVFQLDDTSHGYRQLHEVLKKVSTNENSRILAGFESTGGYENKWVEAIKTFDASLNIQVARISPTVINASTKTTLQQNKTDKSSAISIAEYLIRFEDVIDFTKDDKWYHLRQQWKYICLLTEQRVALQNYLEKLLYTYNPSLIQYCKGRMPGWLLVVIEKYPTSHRLRNSKTSTLIGIPYVTAERARLLRKSAKENSGLSGEGMDIIITDIVRQIKHLESVKKRQMDILRSRINTEDIEILSSFKGIDDVSAIALLVEIGDIRRFKTAKQMTGFFGVHPVYRQSGDGTYGMHMSRFGRSQVKKTLYMIALVSIRHNRDIRHYYLSKQIQGKTRMSALGACMHKITRIIWGMLTSRTKFVSQIQESQIDELEKKLNSFGQRMAEHSDHERRKKRVYQDFDSDAPVSRRESNKRSGYRSREGQILLEKSLQ